MSNAKLYVGIFSGILGVIVASIIYVNNVAIGYENNIDESKSGIQVQEKRQHDLILRLVDVVASGANYEKETQTKIAELRASDNIDINQALTFISAVAENYPDLKANVLYSQLMTELAISENLKAQYRDTYNRDVKLYKVFVRKFPNKQYLSLVGYEIKDYDYLEFNNTDLPDNLFEK